MMSNSGRQRKERSEGNPLLGLQLSPSAVALRSSASKPPRGQYSRSGDGRSLVGDDSQHDSLEYVGETEETEEVQSPLKQ